MSKKNGICKEEVCFCIKNAIVNEDDNCLFIPEGESSWEAYLDQWNDVDDEDDEAIVIINPIEEFSFEEDKYFRIIKTVGYEINDFRPVEKNFGIYVYLVKRSYSSHGRYVYYYNGKQVHDTMCPPTYADIRYLFRRIPELEIYNKELSAIYRLITGFEGLRAIIEFKL